MIDNSYVPKDKEMPTRQQSGNSAFEAVSIKVASPEVIRSWSHGEIKNPETINYRSFKPEKGGLFCERIFGPQRDWECNCGKYKRVKHKGIICDRCGVEVTLSKVRRERMGHIELAVPVSHIWFFKCMPSRIGLMLDMTARTLERIIYYEDWVVTDPGDTPLKLGQSLNEMDYRQAREEYQDAFQADMGAPAIRSLLSQIELEPLRQELEVLLTGTKNKAIRKKLSKRLRLVEGFQRSNSRPEWMILEVLPVIPPDLRPLVPLEGGRFATSDLNDLYRRVINRNNRLKNLLQLRTPEVIIRNEKRMLQEAVDALLDNGRHGRAVTGAGNRPLKSLSDMLKGKQGRFRQNLLGKRVDYSGRSVIVVGPELKLAQCGLPKKMALVLFEPFIIRHLKGRGYAHTVRSAKKMIERGESVVWDILEEVTKGHPVMLNRAPTLHRLSIQAFDPILIEGSAIRLHPLVCTAFNADFDGDQMAVHVPLSGAAQLECKLLMLSSNNIFSPANGKPIMTPTQDITLGSYYLTIEPRNPAKARAFKDIHEVLFALDTGHIHIHDAIRIPNPDFGVETPHGNAKDRFLLTTAGRCIFNSIWDKTLGFYNGVAKKKELGALIAEAYAHIGHQKTVEQLDRLKNLGYEYATVAGFSISIADMVVPKQKGELIAKARTEIDKINDQYNKGALTQLERYHNIIDTWTKTSNAVAESLFQELEGVSKKEINPVYAMLDSGARGSKDQIRQLAGMRGLMADTNGRTIEIPIKANFREGLSALEYFISSRGARKGMTDTALRTADSGYLTRRMVDVCQDVIIRENDCGSTNGSWKGDYYEKGQLIDSFGNRIRGRYPVYDITDPKTGELLHSKDVMLREEDAAKFTAHGIDRVYVRSVLGCKARSGVCARCYGMNLATSELVNLGEAVGIIAAQSIGEPGTQLTMRTFHTGGVAGDDITQGLPRVEELFEARKPKKMAQISEIDGVVDVDDSHRTALRNITITADDGEVKQYQVPYSVGLKVEHGKRVRKGEPITDGALNPHDVLRISGVEAVQDYLTQGVLAVYRQQGVDINEKHIEVIIRQMMRKVKVEEPGDTTLLSGTVVDMFEFEDANAAVQARIDAGETDLKFATDSLILMGITKASLATESWLSAASFQETTKVLTDAAIKGKVDHLVGLKENVIIGKLIPAGSGLKAYRDFDTLTTPESIVTEEMIDDEKL